MKQLFADHQLLFVHAKFNLKLPIHLVALQQFECTNKCIEWILIPRKTTFQGLNPNVFLNVLENHTCFMLHIWKRVKTSKMFLYWHGLNWNIFMKLNVCWIFLNFKVSVSDNCLGYLHLLCKNIPNCTNFQCHKHLSQMYKKIRQERVMSCLLH